MSVDVIATVVYGFRLSATDLPVHEAADRPAVAERLRALPHPAWADGCLGAFAESTPDDDDQDGGLFVTMDGADFDGVKVIALPDEDEFLVSGRIAGAMNAMRTAVVELVGLSESAETDAESAARVQRFCAAVGIQYRPPAWFLVAEVG